MDPCLSLCLEGEWAVWDITHKHVAHWILFNYENRQKEIQERVPGFETNIISPPWTPLMQPQTVTRNYNQFAETNVGQLSGH